MEVTTLMLFISYLVPRGELSSTGDINQESGIFHNDGHNNTGLGTTELRQSSNNTLMCLRPLGTYCIEFRISLVKGDLAEREFEVLSSLNMKKVVERIPKCVNDHSKR